MTVEIIDLYRVNETTNEYGNLGKVVGYFSTMALAQKGANGQGWWGSEGRITKIAGLCLPSGDVYALEQAEPVSLDGALSAEERQKIEDERRKAELLARLNLSDEDKRLLGVS